MFEEQVLEESLELEENLEESKLEDLELKQEELEPKKESKPTIIFGVLSVIFAHLADFTIVGLVLGILGIVKGVKCRDKSDTPLALSIIGTSLSALNFASMILAYIMLTVFFIVYFGMMIFTIIMTGDLGSGEAAGGTLY